MIYLELKRGNVCSFIPPVGSCRYVLSMGDIRLTARILETDAERMTQMSEDLVPLRRQAHVLLGIAQT